MTITTLAKYKMADEKGEVCGTYLLRDSLPHEPKGYVITYTMIDALGRIFQREHALHYVCSPEAWDEFCKARGADPEIQEWWKLLPRHGEMMFLNKGWLNSFGSAKSILMDHFHGMSKRFGYRVVDSYHNPSRINPLPAFPFVSVDPGTTNAHGYDDCRDPDDQNYSCNLMYCGHRRKFHAYYHTYFRIWNGRRVRNLRVKRSVSPKVTRDISERDGVIEFYG